jgi:predicted enzyme related to lactoylglutathione lyase
LRRFYEAVFGWQFYVIADDYLSLETYPHSHDEAGNDINPPVVLDVKHGVVLWRYASEEGKGRVFVPGIPEGGLGRGEPGVTVYVEVDDLRVCLAAVSANGGEITGEPIEIPGYATLGSFRDPEGNVIGLQQPISASG